MVCSKCGKVLDTVRVFRKRACYIGAGDRGINITVSGQWIDKEIVRAIINWDGINAFRVPSLFDYISVSEDGSLIVNDIDILCPYCGASLIKKTNNL